jgi:hypothetical protein
MPGTAIMIIVVAVILVIWLLGQSVRTVRPTSSGLANTTVLLTRVLSF